MPELPPVMTANFFANPRSKRVSSDFGVQLTISRDLLTEAERDLKHPSRSEISFEAAATELAICLRRSAPLKFSVRPVTLSAATAAPVALRRAAQRYPTE
jgi:hypothetical protein